MEGTTGNSQGPGARSPPGDKGPPKKKRGAAWSGRSRVGGSEAKKGPGSDLFFDIFSRVFELPEKRPKNVIKNREKIGFGFLVEFFVKAFRHDFFVKCFCNVFELPSLKNTRKRDKTKKVEEKLSMSKTFGKSFRHGLFAKIFVWCF
jgi:hypothetical protein